MNLYLGIDLDNIDEDELREELINYFGPATPIEEMAIGDIVNASGASKKELVRILKYETNLDIRRFEKK